MTITQRVSDGGERAEPAWTEIEHAAIAELIGFGTSYATPSLQSLLGALVHTECGLRVVCSRRDAAHFLQGEIATPVVAVSRRFSGSYAGVLTVILPENARRMIMGQVSLAGDRTGQEATNLARFADVLLTQCLAEMETTLGLGLKPEKVSFDRGFPYDVVVPNGAGLEDQLFVFALEVGLGKRSAAVPLLVGVDRTSTAALKRYLQEFLDIDAGPDQTH